MKNIKKYAINLLLLGILFLIPAIVSAASNWQFMNEENGSRYYIDINSIERKGDSVFYNTKQIYSQGNYDIITMEYKPDKRVMRYYWEKQYDTNGRLVQSVSTTDINPFGPVSPEYTEIQIVNRILAENKNNSQPSQQVSEPPKSVDTSTTNTVTKFPQEMGNLRLILAKPIKSGAWNDDVPLVADGNIVRCVVISHPSTTISLNDSSLRFKLDNGQYAGISLDLGKLSFEGYGSQPAKIEGGLLEKYQKTGEFANMRFNGGVELYAFGDGRLGVAFFYNNDKKTFVAALPEGAKYFTGVVSGRNIATEIAFYR